MHISDRLRAVKHHLTHGSRKRPGTPPGTLVYEGEQPAKPVRIQLYDYTADRLNEYDVSDIEELSGLCTTDGTTWINVDGVHDVEVVEKVGRLFDVHPLTLEDVVSTDQRPKMEEYPDYVYVVLQMMHYDHEQAQIATEQVSIIFGDGFLISFQEITEGDVFDPVRRRLRDARGHIRNRKADYLAYALVDVIVDYYMEILEGLGEHIVRLEDRVTDEPEPDVMRDINRLRRKVLLLRRSIWPLRDVIVALERCDRDFMTTETDLFFRDVYDHTVRTVELIESAREVLATLTDLHLSTLSFRSNEIMKILAIIATIFLPLTFIAGVYGMNFDVDASPFNMPELGWYFGYPFALALMLAVAATMVIFFRRKGWM